MTVGANRLADTFARIGGLVVTPADAYILADPDTHQIRRLPASGAGQRIAGMADGSAGFNGAVTLATNTPLNQPHGVAYDAVAGDVYVCDTGNDRVRHLAGGTLNTRIGGGTDTGDTVTLATDAQLSAPMGLARDAAGHLFFTERTTSRVRRYDAVTKRLTTLATGPGNGPIALDDANDVVWVAKGGVVTAISNINGATATLAIGATFQAQAGTGAPQVTGLAYDGAGTLYVAQTTLPGTGGPVDARIYRVSVDTSGRATAAPELIAGTGGQDASPGAYSVPTTDASGPLQLLAGASWCGLTIGADGRLYAGNSYPGQWGQVLRLAPAP
ncbi:Serine/threonine-protein kinase PknD [compost metagenome]